MIEICSMSTIKIPAKHHDGFIVNFERSGISIVYFEQVKDVWKIAISKFFKKSKDKDPHCLELFRETITLQKEFFKK